MHKNYLSFIIAIYFVAITNCGFCQSSVNTDPLKQVIENTITAYQKSIGAQSKLYRGLGYEFYDLQTTSSPYFKDSIAFTNGSVKYDGDVYKDIPLLYDVNKQLLVIYSYDNASKISLFNDYVTEFDARGHHFINYKPDSVNRKMDAGFYDEIYKGKHQVLARRTKSRQQESLTQRTIFIPTIDYYIKMGDKYIAINSKGKLLDVLNDKKKEMKKYIKATGIDFSDNKEQSIILTVAHYDQISN